MRYFAGLMAVWLFLYTAVGVSQKIASDEDLLVKARSLYDAPFLRNLNSFDCAVEFDWKQHFIGILGSVPPEAVPTQEQLQTVKHRVLVSRAGATVFAIPKAPDLSGVTHGAELEQVFNAMIASGLNAWIPASTNVMLPVGATKFSFEKVPTGYRLTMNGSGVDAIWLLGPDLRLMSGVTHLPQPMRIATEFSSGPSGFLLSSLKTGDTTDVTKTKEASFSYTYQSVQGFQIPAAITIKPVTTGIWHYTLTDCKVMTGPIIEIRSPVK